MQICPCVGVRVRVRVSECVGVGGVGGVGGEEVEVGRVGVGGVGVGELVGELV